MHILRLQPKGTGVFTLSVKEQGTFPKGKQRDRYEDRYLL